MRYLLAFLAFPFVSVGANYYVATNGNNGNVGSEAQPWLTVGYAITNSTTGDRVIIGQGNYSEFLTNTTSGVTFEGTRGAAGEWLTVIDPSTDSSSGWVLASEIGTNVYKKTGLGFPVREMTIDGKRVGFAYAVGQMSNSINAAYSGSGLTEGLQFLTLASDATLNFGAYSITFWNSIGAMYCSTGSVCYLRFKDGGSPNGSNVWIAPNADSAVTITPYKPAIKVSGLSGIVWSNVAVQNAFCGYYINGSTNITVASNSISGGLYAVYLDNSAASNTVIDCYISGEFYGYASPGAYSTATAEPYLSKYHLYAFSKWIMGGQQSASFDERISLSSTGDGNTLHRNHIYKSIGSGITIGKTDNPPFYYTIISENRIEKHPSVGILLSEGNTETRISGNYVGDCNINIRPHHWDTGSETNKVIYVYRNTFWEPTSRGEHFYFHFNNNDGMTYYPWLYCYQNSFSGGNAGITASPYAADQDGLTNCWFINNIFSGTQYYYADYLDWHNPNLVGIFDYNLTTPPYRDYGGAFPPWFGANNITNTTVQWVNSDGMSFVLTNGSPAINAGLDIPATYPTLPWSGTKVGAAWDMGALEFGSPGILNIGTLRAQNMILR